MANLNIEDLKIEYKHNYIPIQIMFQKFEKYFEEFVFNVPI